MEKFPQMHGQVIFTVQWLTTANWIFVMMTSNYYKVEMEVNKKISLQ